MTIMLIMDMVTMMVLVLFNTTIAIMTRILGTKNGTNIDERISQYCFMLIVRCSIPKIK